MDVTHRFPLGNTPWTVWREVLLRTTGFPAAGLDRLAAPRCAAVADAHLEGAAEPGAFATEFGRAVTACSAELRRISADPLLREAITWQNPPTVVLLDAIAGREPSGSRTSKWRYREQQLSRYWQRYCAKTETIGFFGPLTWAALDPSVPDFDAAPGPRLLDRRRVFLEPWALAAYGARLSEDPELRRRLPPAPMPHFWLDGDLLRRPGRDPVTLTERETAVLTRCDGRRPAAGIVADLVADARTPVGTPDEGYGLLAGLASRKLIRWDANLPVAPHTEAVLDDRIAAIGDDGLRRRAAEGLRRLRAARAAVAGAAGDPAALASAMAALDAEFTALTGREPRQRLGQTYAGRGLCYEDTTRDLRLTVGSRVIDAMAPALALVMQIARWLTADIAAAYERELLRLADKGAGGPVRLSDIWYPAIELISGRGTGPVDDGLEELVSRWRTLFGLPCLPEAQRRVEFTSARLAGRVADLFAADRPGWSAARVHSPDLHICAESVEAVNRGDFLVVLGELHVASGTLCDRAVNWPKAEPGRMLEAMVRDFGRPRMVPLLPLTWSKYAGRLVYAEPAPGDWNIAFTRTGGVEAHRLVPTEAVTVEVADGRPVATLPDGERVPAIEVFGMFLSTVVADAFKGVTRGPHTPRVTVDRLVVSRETWRMTAAHLAGLTLRGDEPGQYLAGRRLVAEHGLPDRCFAKIATESKPVYVDFTSPAFVASFGSAVRAAAAAHGDRTQVAFSEMLPTQEQTWVPDRDGRTYFGELRLQVTDPAYADTVDRTADVSAAYERR